MEEAGSGKLENLAQKLPSHRSVRKFPPLNAFIEFRFVSGYNVTP